jgi:hypothetical protein
VVCVTSNWEPSEWVRGGSSRQTDKRWCL